MLTRLLGGHPQQEHAQNSIGAKEVDDMPIENIDVSYKTRIRKLSEVRNQTLPTPNGNLVTQECTGVVKRRSCFPLPEIILFPQVAVATTRNNFSDVS